MQWPKCTPFDMRICLSNLDMRGLTNWVIKSSPEINQRVCQSPFDLIGCRQFVTTTCWQSYKCRLGSGCCGAPFLGQCLRFRNLGVFIGMSRPDVDLPMHSPWLKHRELAQECAFWGLNDTSRHILGFTVELPSYMTSINWKSQSSWKSRTSFERMIADMYKVTMSGLWKVDTDKSNIFTS